MQYMCTDVKILYVHMLGTLNKLWNFDFTLTYYLHRILDIQKHCVYLPRFDVNGFVWKSVTSMECNRIVSDLVETVVLTVLVWHIDYRVYGFKFI